MGRKIEFSIGEFYHLYNRGTDKRVIFTDDHDHRRFIALLYLCNSSNSLDIRSYFYEGLTFVELFGVDRGEPLVELGAYCLMPNHFHLLTKEIKEGGTSLFMQKLMSAYVGYFNRRHQRGGGLFEGRYKGAHAGTDEYLKYLFSYIHLNPVKLIQSDWKENGLRNKNATIEFLRSYVFSSYRDYILEDRVEKNILNREAFPDYFSDSFSFENLILEWLNYSKKLPKATLGAKKIP